MGELSKSSASLRLFGDDLMPDEITALLGHAPTGSYIKGQPRDSRYLGNQVVFAKYGSWRLSFRNKMPGDLDCQIKDIFDLLTDDFSIWKALSETYRLDMFCSLSLKTYNEGISLSVETLKALADRHVFIDFDIYHNDEEE